MTWRCTFSNFRDIDTVRIIGHSTKNQNVMMALTMLCVFVFLPLLESTQMAQLISIIFKILIQNHKAGPIHK